MGKAQSPKEEEEIGEREREEQPYRYAQCAWRLTAVGGDAYHSLEQASWT